eukprot:TRINITY_DN1924_c0_g4_i2.p1 TRINITY_DN1924_c0_g4~~TRINITY_DN1924_c0_g4_i2.p1  ORF type:complete len:430 (-),score=66.01 TRINITY_DN1924_c0_g4_i2:501-1790(-)
MQPYNLRRLKPFKPTEFVLPVLNETRNDRSTKSENVDFYKRNRLNQTKVMDRKEVLKSKRSTTLPNNVLKPQSTDAINFIADGTKESLVSKAKSWKCDKAWLLKMRSLHNGNHIINQIDVSMKELADHFFETMKLKLQHFFKFDGTISLHSSNGDPLNSFADIDPKAHLVIVKRERDKWLGLRRAIVFPKIISSNIAKVMKRKEVKKMNLLIKDNAEMTPEEMCQRYSITYGQFLYLSGKHDIQLRNSKAEHAVPLEWLVKCKGEILFGLEKTIVERVCIARGIHGEVSKSQYVWLWCLLVYNTLPLEEVVDVWKFIFDPYEMNSVPCSELRQVLILLSRTCQPLEVDFGHKRFAYILLDELRKADCLTPEDDLLMDRLVAELMKETKLLLYLAHTITKSSSLPLPLLNGQISNAINHKYNPIPTNLPY